MQRQYCGLENSDSVRTGACCNQRIPAGDAPDKVTGKLKPSARQRRCTDAAYAQFGTHSAADTLRRTRYLTGSTSTISPLDPPSRERSAATATPSPAQSARTEPRWDGASIPPFASVPYEQLEQVQIDNAVPYRLTSKPANPFSRVLWMLAIFAVGASVGVGAAWWKNPDLLQQTGMVGEIQHQQSPLDAHASKAIPASELPYDGQAPQTVGVASPAVPAPEKSVEDASPAMAVADSPGTSKSIATGSSADEERAPPSIAAAAKPEQAQELEKSSDAVPVSREPKQVRLVPRHRPAPKIVRNREIERIRQQAEDELKKKSEVGRRVEEARINSPSKGRRASPPLSVASTSAVIRARFARCDQASNIFRREQCRWRLCGGMWGRNGCPSYATTSSSSPS